MSLTPSVGIVFAAFLLSRTPCFLVGGGCALSRSPTSPSWHLAQGCVGTGLGRLQPTLSGAWHPFPEEERRGTAFTQPWFQSSLCWSRLGDLGSDLPFSPHLRGRGDLSSGRFAVGAAGAQSERQARSFLSLSLRGR